MKTIVHFTLLAGLDASLLTHPAGAQEKLVPGKDRINSRMSYPFSGVIGFSPESSEVAGAHWRPRTFSF